MSSAPEGQTSAHDETLSLSEEVLGLVAALTSRFEQEGHEEWRWIAQHSPNARVVELLRDSTTTAMRVLDAIGQLEPVNGATISAQYHIPKGTVSKVTRRLLVQKLINAESLPNNRKEILFRLAPVGREFVTFHRAFDGQMERGFIAFLRRYDASELRLLARVLRDAIATSFLTLGEQPELGRNDAASQRSEPVGGGK